MAYPAYDTYNQGGVPFPLSRRPSMAYTDGYVDPPLASGAYGEGYSQGSFPVYAPSRQVSQYNGGGGGYAYSDAYDGRDAYYDEGAAGYSTPWTPGLSRRRRHSSVSARQRPSLDSFRRPNGTLVKFRRKGGFRSGVSLGEAMANVRMSGNDDYTFHDLNVDPRGRVVLKIRWSGYTSMTYEIPVDGYEGRVQLQTLARRIARACVHFLQANMIPISWDRVILYHLEEISIGVWQPVLSTS
ncbi:uncharacterized protein PHACADRAFT_249944 [Phanerochaete carnosa HHB-10118-sp]|uniref:DUF6741 domain-containing protein n=1 Tax=Phanerochaete carnosa (strain HHB-10118-sp) TaxID=650164 RepID=K5X991_PHACS|nr:uncharacterized protein PHACADRAFT_249944 [Phanerochaete carnosa HHB-10118-sp]EKM59447.1 hypothetical protein PHACADRAFT_249944 [Phanerochaete carnosa HHB-10118-sp]